MPGMHIKYRTGVKPVERNHSVYKLDDKDHIENMFKKKNPHWITQTWIILKTREEHTGIWRTHC